MTRPTDLTGEARELYEGWRGLGHSQAAAMERVERSGVLREQRMAEQFQRLGLSEAEAKVAARGRDAGRPAAETKLEDQFRRMGLSEAEAKVAAEGRGSRPASGRDSADNPFAKAPSRAEADPFGVKLLASMDETQRQIDDLKQRQDDRTMRGEW